MDDLSQFCCRNSRCPAYGLRDAANLTVAGRIGKSRQFRQLYCRTCRARFSERKGTPLYRAHLAEDKIVSILEHVNEGCGVRKTARLVKVHPDTVSRHGHDGRLVVEARPARLEQLALATDAQLGMSLLDQEPLGFSRRRRLFS
jgi:transposase-like protein